MSTRQPSKGKPGLAQSKHGRHGKENPRQGLNSRKLRASSPQKQTKQTENVDPPNNSKDCLQDPKGGDGSGGSGGGDGDETQTREQNKNTGSTTQPEVTMSDTKSPSNGDKNGPKTGTEETNTVFQQKDGEKENKHSQSKKPKPLNKKSNESQHRDKSEAKRTEDKHKPTKKPSKGDSRQKRGKTDTKHSEHDKNDQPETKDNGESDGKNTQNENQETNDQPNGADSTQNEEDELQLQKQKKKRSLDEDSLQMFLSTDDIGDDKQRPWMGPDQYSDETKRKQEEIIRRILEEFDLEETMKKYRNSNVLVYRRDGKSLADFRFRSELLRMMGSEEIRLNDREWNRKFEEKLREDYNRLLDEQEYNLAQAEKTRIHRLRVGGVIPDEGDLEGHSTPRGSGSEHRVPMSHHALARTPAHSLKNKSREDPAALKQRSQEESPHCKPVFADEESNRRERNLNAHRQEKIYYPPEDVQTQMDRMERGEQKEGRKVEVDHKHSEQGSESLSSSSIMDPDGKNPHYAVSTSSGVRNVGREDEEGRGGRTRRKHGKNLPPCIARLYEEETTSGLYNLAKELLGPPKS